VANFWAASFARGVKPDPDLDLAAWSDEFGYLSPEASAVSGRWRCLPYQVEIMRSMTDKKVERVSFLKSARVGYTKMLNQLCGYHMHQAPANIMFVLPTLHDAEQHSITEIAPMLRDTKVLRDLVGASRTKNSENTITRKKFRGGTLVMVGANSATSFRRVSIKVLILDEVDGYPAMAGGGRGAEGDPVSLAIRRTEWAWDRKIIMGSTPTIKGLSRIETAWDDSDQRLYEVPCPECGAFHPILWENIRWEDGRPETAAHACQSCGVLWGHQHKRKAITKGRWVVTRPEVEGHHGYRLWSGYSLSPNSTWSNLVREFLVAKTDPALLQTFVNTQLGETWELEQGDAVEPHSLMLRAEDFSGEPMPDGVLVLTAGVDVQQDRLELEVVGWGEGEESWSIDYRVLHGDTSRIEVWAQLDEVLGESWITAGGVSLRVAATCIDSGASTATVYDFVGPRQGRRIWAIKGSSHAARPIVGKPSKVDKGRVSLIPVGTDTAKELIMARLKIEEHGPGYCHIPKGREEEWFYQLTSEKAVQTYHKGVPKREWRKIRQRNEGLDCRVYALAAVRFLNPRMAAIKRNLTSPPVERPVRRGRRRYHGGI
jgi:terminase, large subunit